MWRAAARLRPLARTLAGSCRPSTRRKGHFPWNCGTLDAHSPLHNQGFNLFASGIVYFVTPSWSIDPPALLAVHLDGGPHAGVGAVLGAGPAHQPLQAWLGRPPRLQAVPPAALQAVAPAAPVDRRLVPPGPQGAGARQLQGASGQASQDRAGQGGIRHEAGRRQDKEWTIQTDRC